MKQEIKRLSQFAKLVFSLWHLQHHQKKTINNSGNIISLPTPEHAEELFFFHKINVLEFSIFLL